MNENREKDGELTAVALAAAVGVAHAGIHRLRIAGKYGPDMASSRELAIEDAAKLFEQTLTLLRGKEHRVC